MSRDSNTFIKEQEFFRCALDCLEKERKFSRTAAVAQVLTFFVVATYVGVSWLM